MTAKDTFKFPDTNRLLTHKRTSPNQLIGRESFIRIWQRSDTTYEVMKKTGLTEKQAIDKARNLRHKGIPLKQMRKNFVDWDRLKEIATEELPKRKPTGKELMELEKAEESK